MRKSNPPIIDLRYLKSYLSKGAGKKYLAYVELEEISKT